ncbi:hypothetical protein FALBO_12262, partial [Fusarium albosuccineum]
MLNKLRTRDLALDLKAIHMVNEVDADPIWMVAGEQGPVERDLLQNVPIEVSKSDPPQLPNSVDTLVDRDATELASVSPPPSAPLQLASVSKNSLPVLPSYGCSTAATLESESPVKFKVEASQAPPQPSPPKESRTKVIRGFEIPQQHEMRPIPASVQASSDAVFQSTSTPALGGCCLSNEQDQSLINGTPFVPIIKKPMFQIGGSSEEDGFLLTDKEQSSSNGSVITGTNPDEAAVDSDTDYIDESAIDDDDDSSDWEDSIEDSEESSMDDQFFQRIDSKPNLTSRRSLITLMLAQNERARTLGNHASQFTSAIPRSRAARSPSLGASPNDSDEAPLKIKGMRGPGLKPIHEVPRSSAQPIMVGPSHVQAQAALSPRTTRRNMLATELT